MLRTLFRLGVVFPSVIPFFCMTFVVAFSTLTLAQQEPPTNRDIMWKHVDEAIQQGLPKTALERLQPIIDSALKEKAFPAAIKAIAKRIVLKSEVEGNQPEQRILLMQAEIAKAPPETVPVLRALLGSWYWSYFEQNRWRFSNRTSTSVAVSDDFQTWDLARLFDEIDKNYAEALKDAKLLQTIPIATYEELLPKGTLPDAYRPTLYDFLTFEAIDFYSVGEQAGAKSEDSFEIDADGPALGSMRDFLAWEPKTTDSQSPKRKAILLYQDLLRFHQGDADKSAMLDAELGRLRFCQANAVGEEKEVRTIAALKTFADTHAKHPLSASARYQWAQMLMADNDLVEARDVALQGKNAFPESAGGKHCRNLISTIESKSMNIVTERVWTDSLPVIRVTYKNLNQVYFRAIQLDWVNRLDANRWMPSQLNEVDREQFLKKAVAASWKATLPETSDFAERSQDVEPPKTLKPGYYIIIGSSKEDFSDTDNTVSACEVWVTNLAIVVRQDWGRDKLEGFVLNAKSGEPIANAKVRSFVRNNQTGKFGEGESTKTNSDGLFVFTGSNRNMLLLASNAGNEISTINEVSLYSQQAQPFIGPHFVLFADRALYRPGQTIFFKGIALQADPNNGKYSVVAGREVTTTFRDSNGTELEKLSLRTNDYGSFQGSFSAPRDRGTGMMSLQIQDGSGANQMVRVEEYKRPKFEVTVERSKVPMKLGVETTLTGKATSYTGAAINGAKVRYRVTRSVRWPGWFMTCFSWRMPPMSGQAQEIAHGFVTTGDDGSFTVTFVPRPDRTVQEEDQPIFQYTITADVTDGTGETRTASQTVSVGYTALALNASAEEWQTADVPVAFKLETTTLDGEGLAAKGTLTVHKLKEPATVIRPDLFGRWTPTPRPNRRLGGVGARPGANSKPAKGAAGKPSQSEFDGANPNTWELGDRVESQPFECKADGVTSASMALPRGHYRAMVETQDEFGKPVRAQWTFQMLDPKAKSLGLKLPSLLVAPKWEMEPGEKFQALWGSGNDKARAYIEIEHHDKVLKSYWTKPDSTQVMIEQAVEESMRGGFTIRTTCVRENRAYLESRVVDVPWSNKDLKLKWDRFVSKLEPGARETFTLTISGPEATKATAEMVASLYDASLDAYVKHDWQQRFNVFRRESTRLSSVFNNSVSYLQPFRGSWETNYVGVDERYRRFPDDLKQVLMPMMAMMDFGMARGSGGGVGRARSMSLGTPMMKAMRGESSPAESAPVASMDMSAESFRFVEAEGESGGNEPKSSGPNLSDIPIRTNLNETAFFFPQLISDKEGVVKLEFTMPEALTKWRFLGFAHDAQLRSGFLTDSLVTAKDLMVQPNPPRFLREGDTIEFSVKVSNQSDKQQVGKVALQLLDARTNEPVDLAYQNSEVEKSFDVPAKQSKSFAWKLQVPDGAFPIIYKAMGGTEKVSDGEQGMLPVLSKRILVTESIPLPIRGKSTRDFEFKKLLDSKDSTTLQHQSLTVQMTSQPAWYAVLALPYLMEYPHQCSEQTFNRLYANSLAKHIAGSDPKIQRVFETWRQIQPQALDSPLSKNQDLKSVMIEETPWLRDATNESQARRNVGLLFDENKLAAETSRAMKQLVEMQRENGMWPWFPGGPDNEYLSLYIVTGFGRLKNLKVQMDDTPAIRALERLDAWVHEQYDRIQRDSKDPESNHLSTTIALYLYGRSFFLETRPIEETHRIAVDYWKRQAAKYWLNIGNRQSQAHIALGLKRMNDLATAKAIAASLKERSVSDEELGMFWRDTERSWWWYQAPIESQAMMIEVFDEVAMDAGSVEDCKVWLLKQKQTQNWSTTKGTADAVYSLLLRGTSLLSSDALVEVKLAGVIVQPANVEAGTGFYSQRFERGEIKAEMGAVSLTKRDEGVSWGSLHWQYLEDTSKITPHDGTPLKLEKMLFKRTLTKSGPILEPIEKGALEVGDEVICRVVLRTDRDMEYVHLKDHRGSGTEPVNVLSQYKFQDGLAYYESTRDTASHFFIDYLPKGTYVFEYPIRIQHAGSYPSGMANVECMYAPEFNSHSASIMMNVR